jgi:SAM-dependent methyltransferase
MALFGQSLILRDFPERKDIKGIGLSDWPGYANVLTQKFRYSNTFFHADPYLDIKNPSGMFTECDFLISTEVFEHVHPPVQAAFDGARKVLKRGGVLILTVPFTNTQNTIEHFDEFEDFKLVRIGSENVVVGRKADGTFAVRTDLVFHGGPGQTLEMRVFCRKDIERLLFRAGFTSVQVMQDSCLDWGIVHPHQWSLPITAICE